MKGTSAFLMVMAGIVMTASGAEVSQVSPQKVEPAFHKSIKYTAVALRGALQGYKKGMYKMTNYKVSADCLGNSTQQYLIDTFDNYGTLTFDWQVEIINFSQALMMVTQNCEYDECLNDWLTFCYEGEQCDSGVMMQTMLKKIFQVTTIANDLAQMYAEGQPGESSSLQDVQDFYERFGSNFGKLLRYSTDFDPNLITLLYQ